MKQEQLLEKAALVRERLGRATRAAALTGAGVSAESGVPTFRGPEGLWRNHQASDLATPEAFARNPRLVWEWYDWRRSLIAPLQPNPGHLALARLENLISDFTLITQNVDGLHRAAGSRNVLELHGSLWRTKCVSCGRKKEDRTVPLPYPPLCPECGDMVRPDVVWFGEQLDSAVLESAFKAAQKADIMIVAGTSAVVQPAASLAWQAQRAGTFVVEINPEKTPFSDEADLVLAGPSGEILPLLVGDD